MASAIFGIVEQELPIARTWVARVLQQAEPASNDGCDRDGCDRVRQQPNMCDNMCENMRGGGRVYTYIGAAGACSTTAVWFRSFRAHATV